MQPAKLLLTTGGNALPPPRAWVWRRASVCVWPIVARLGGAPDRRCDTELRITSVPKMNPAVSGSLGQATLIAVPDNGTRKGTVEATTGPA